MIESISIKSVATFDEKGVSFNNLNKLNFIYGPNGSGKTTISNYTFETVNPKFFNCSLKWRNNIPLKILVYNKDFRERNLGKGKMRGVFTLGQATKEQVFLVDEKKTNLDEIKRLEIQHRTSQEHLKSELMLLENNFREVVWDKIYKKHEQDFKEAFRGSLTKEYFKLKLLSEVEINSAEIKSLEFLQSKANTIFGEQPQHLPLISKVEFNQLVEIGDNELWKKKILGKADIDLGVMIQRLNMNDWVNQGREYIDEKSNICPFCQQPTINETFRKKLSDYFDAEFIQNTSRLFQLKNLFFELSDKLLIELNGILTLEKVNNSTKLNVNAFSDQYQILSQNILLNRELINNKIKEPSRLIELHSFINQLQSIDRIITDANNEINVHNEVVANFQTEKNLLIKQIWKYLIRQNKELVDAYINKKSNLNKGLSSLTTLIGQVSSQATALEKEIRNLTKSLTSIEPTVNEINQTLGSFGFSNFKIVPSNEGTNHYLIQREDGSIADSTLSEGEITFITILYFLQLAKGGISEDTIADDRVLVIDDPICSLDSSILFVVSSLIKDVIKSIKENKGSIKQLILLTHNIYFHKEISFINGRVQEDKDTFHWILRRRETTTELDFYDKRNPISTSYELLWKELYESKSGSVISIQNVMRRIIEYYFRFLGKYGDDVLIEKFKRREEKEICRSLLSWINDGSHGFPDDLFIEHQDAVIRKYHVVFKQIFDKMGHIEHYNMMLNSEEIEDLIQDEIAEMSMLE